MKTIIKEACQTAKEEINSGRENGDRIAKDFVAPIKTLKSFDKLIVKSASLMGQMTGSGVAILMCPIKVISKELKQKK
jgi:hypothetical protein